MLSCRDTNGQFRDLAPQSNGNVKRKKTGAWVNLLFRGHRNNRLSFSLKILRRNSKRNCFSRRSRTKAIVFLGVKSATLLYSTVAVLPLGTGRSRDSQ